MKDSGNRSEVLLGINANCTMGDPILRSRCGIFRNKQRSEKYSNLHLPLSRRLQSLIADMHVILLEDESDITGEQNNAPPPPSL